MFYAEICQIFRICEYEVVVKIWQDYFECSWLKSMGKIRDYFE